jgi:hypothetical protein
MSDEYGAGGGDLLDGAASSNGSGGVLPLVTNNVRATAEKIADWCKERHDQISNDARNQVWSVWGLLIGGLLLLVFLPNIFLKIDRELRDNRTPTQIIDAARTSAAEVARSRDEINGELKIEKAKQTELEDENANVTASIKGSRKEISANLISKYVFRRNRSVFANAEIVKMYAGIDGRVYAIGKKQKAQNERLQSGSKLESDAILAVRDFAGDWTYERVERSGNKPDRQFDIHEIMVNRAGNRFLAGFDLNNDRPFIMHNIDGSWTDAELPETVGDDVDLAEIYINSLYIDQGGKMFAAGIMGPDDKPNPFIWSTVDGRKWTDLDLGNLAGSQVGSVYKMIQLSDGTYLAIGDGESEDASSFRIIESKNGVVWHDASPRMEDGEFYPGYAEDIGQARNGDLYLVGSNWEDSSAFIMTKSGKGDWSRKHLFDQDHEIEELQALYLDGTGSLIFVGSTALSEGVIAAIEPGAAIVTHHSVENITGKPMGAFYDIERLPDGNFLIAGASGVIESGQSLSLKELQDTLTSRGDTGDELLLKAGTVHDVNELGRLTDRHELLNRSIGRQVKFRSVMEHSYNRQVSAAKTSEILENQLTDALRGADEWRQAGEIATRLAILGVLMYLVQIVVNRYRYLQRLADFYLARSHAFRLLASSSTETALLKGMTVADLTATLSPDGVGFDKVPATPAGELIKALGAAGRIRAG